MWGTRGGTRWRRAARTGPGTSPAPYDGFDTMLVNGTWRRGGGGRVVEDRDPYTDDVLVRIPLADEQDLDEAYRAAAAAQPAWAARRPAERSAVLRRAAAIMEDRREEIVDWLIRESGQHADQGGPSSGNSPAP